MTSTNDTANEGVITSYAQAPARTVTAGGVTYAYRELGPKGGIPVIFFVHLAATINLSVFRRQPCGASALGSACKSR
jgi:hypothetical protein